MKKDVIPTKYQKFPSNTILNKVMSLPKKIVDVENNPCKNYVVVFGNILVHFGPYWGWSRS